MNCGKKAGKCDSAQCGYIILTLLLFVSVIVVALAVVAPTISFEVKRDREEELVHRGVEYSRAIQRFAKANARYPLRIEELQSTNNMRFIRKLYKDPVTGDDFRPLYMSDIRVATGTTVAGDPGFHGEANNGAGTPASNTPSSTQSQPSENQSLEVQTTENQNSSAVNNSPASSFLGQSGSNATQPGNPPGLNGQPNPQANNSMPFGSKGAIVGVASKSKAGTIREYDKKNHYNDWLFFYMPNYTRGRLITGPTPLTLPANAPLNGATPIQNQPAAAPTEQK